MRLIDADAVINGVRNRCLGQNDVIKVEHSILSMLDRTPTVDAIPISFIQELIKQDNQFIEAYDGIQKCEVIVDGLIERAVNYEALIEKWREKNAKVN